MNHNTTRVYGESAITYHYERFFVILIYDIPIVGQSFYTFGIEKVSCLWKSTAFQFGNDDAFFFLGQNVKVV